MGKTKGRVSKARCEWPVGWPSVSYMAEINDDADESSPNTTLQYIIEKLQSGGVEDRECAACAIAKLVDNPEFVANAMDSNIVKIAAPLLIDSNVAVRHAIAGCLRNLSACGGHVVCKSMVEQDVMTPLIALLLQYSPSWKPKKSVEGKIDSKTEIFTECCNILWSLCESSDVAVSIFNDNNIISILLPCLNIEVFGLQIPLTVAQCLHTVAEDNPSAIKALSEPQVVEVLQSLMSLKPLEPTHALLKALASGILLHAHFGNISNCSPSTTLVILGVVSGTLEIPITPDLERFSREIESHKAERRNKYREHNVLEEKLAALHSISSKLELFLAAKQIALEILTNVCFSDDSSEWEDVGSSDTNEEIGMDVDDTIYTPVKISLNVPFEVHAAIVNQKLLNKVLDQIITPPKDITQNLKGTLLGRNCLKRLQTVRCTALLCANNILQGLDVDELGGRQELFQLWINLANLVFKQTDISDTEQLEAATISLRAVLQKLVESECFSQFNQMTESDLHLLIGICQNVQDAGVKVNVIRSVGTLGCLLGNIRPTCPSKLVKEIGIFLIDICGRNSELRIIAEALDAIFDVFGEDHLDFIVQEINLMEKLNNLLPILKGKIKQQSKCTGEHMPIIMTAKTNLIRFIKYKRERTKQ